MSVRQAKRTTGEGPRQPRRKPRRRLLWPGTDAPGTTYPPADHTAQATDYPDNREERRR